MSNLDLVHEKLGGHKYERYIATNCCFHNDTKPSLFIYPDKYFCASCGARGTTASLLGKLGTIPERVIVTTTSTSYNNPFTRWRQLGSIQQICDIAKKRRSTYLEERGIPISIQRELEIGVMENWVVFPIFNHYREIIGAVARRTEHNSSGAKYILPPGQSSQLLFVPSWRLIKDQNEVFVTFGIIDAISLYILGKASCSTTTGQHINVDAFANIRKKITFVPDELEEKSAYQISTKLGLRGSVKILPYPYGTKDPADWFLSDRASLELAL